MIEFLFGVEFELSGDIHVLGAAEHLGIDDVGDDCLIFTGKIFVQQLRKAVAGDLVFVCDGLGLSHFIPPLYLGHRVLHARMRGKNQHHAINHVGSGVRSGKNAFRPHSARTRLP